MKQKEIWKDVKGFEGYYKVSNFGRVKSLLRTVCDGRKVKGTILKQDESRGYKRVCLQKNRKRHNKLVHRLVSNSFIENPNNKKFVNHKDGKPSNNYVSNLEWVTRSENQKHAYLTGLQKPLKGIDNKLSKPVAMIDPETDSIIGEFYSAAEASEKTNGNKYAIRNCCRGLTRTSNGFKWEYLSNKFSIDKEIDNHKQYL